MTPKLCRAGLHLIEGDNIIFLNGYDCCRACRLSSAHRGKVQFNLRKAERKRSGKDINHGHTTGRQQANSADISAGASDISGQSRSLDHDTVIGHGQSTPDRARAEGHQTATGGSGSTGSGSGSFGDSPGRSGRDGGETAEFIDGETNRRPSGKQHASAQRVDGITLEEYRAIYDRLKVPTMRSDIASVYQSEIRRKVYRPTVVGRSKHIDLATGERRGDEHVD